MQVIEVAAGLIHRDGRYLIARRKPGAHLAGFWEFPGGKRETGESFTECLQRELFEELSIRIDLPIPYRIIRHDYLDRIIELHFFRCTIEQGEPMPIGCEEIRWVNPMRSSKRCVAMRSEFHDEGGARYRNCPSVS
jgi:mutator protein MutT